MESLLLFVLVVAMDLAKSYAGMADPKIHEIFSSCKKEVNVSKQELQAYREHRDDPNYATNHLKCLLKCGLEKAGLFKDGQVNEAGVADFFEKLQDPVAKLDDVKKAFATCKSERGADDCDTVYKIIKCARKTAGTLRLTA